MRLIATTVVQRALYALRTVPTSGALLASLCTCDSFQANRLSPGVVGALVCLRAAPQFQLSVNTNNGRLHNAQRYHCYVSCLALRGLVSEKSYAKLLP